MNICFVGVAKAVARYQQPGGYLLNLTGTHFRFLPVPFQVAVGGTGPPTYYHMNHILNSLVSAVDINAHAGFGIIAADGIQIRDHKDPQKWHPSQLIPLQLDV